MGRVNGSPLKRGRILKKLDKFERDCRRAGADVNAYPQAKFVEALVSDGHGEFKEMMFRFCIARLYRGDFQDWSGWEYRDDWAISTYQSLPNRRWRLEDVKSLAVLGEQGIGDEIMFGSVLPQVLSRVPKVVVECDPRLIDVFQRSFGVDCRPRQNLSDKREEEAFIPIGDLPRLFRKTAESFPGTPFLSPLTEYVTKWSHLKGRTGVAWRSRTGSFDPKEFGIENPVVLQYDHWPYETKGMEVPDCDLRNSIEDVFGIVANLDRVVSVPQTVVHIAGSIGTKVEVVMPPVESGRVENQIPWRYGTMPWYKSVKVHRSLRDFHACDRRPRP